MKKLLVLAFAVVLTLSLAVVASAATFDPYVGGEFQLNYSPDAYNPDDTTGINTGALENDANGARFKSYVTGKVEDKDTGTWAKVGVRFTSWNYGGTITKLEDTDKDGTAEDRKFGTSWAEVYEAGIKVNDNLTIWYTNDENNDADRGQVPLVQSWFKFGGDPIFDKGPADCLGIKYGSETLDGAFIYGFDKTGSEEANQMIAAATFKFDGGNVYVAYDNETDESTHSLVGMSYKFGFGTLKVDYSVWSAEGADDQTVIQASIDLLDSKLNVTVLSDDGKYFVTDGGMGFGVTYNINDKLYVGGRSVTSNDDADKQVANAITGELSTNGNYQSVFYLGFKYGVFDTRIGSATLGDDDSMFFVSTHVGMW